jgi:hypothetical protein
VEEAQRIARGEDPRGSGPAAFSCSKDQPKLLLLGAASYTPSQSAERVNCELLAYRSSVTSQQAVPPVPLAPGSPRAVIELDGVRAVASEHGA